MLGRADRNCGEWIALFFFFGSEPLAGVQAELTEIVESAAVVEMTHYPCSKMGLSHKVVRRAKEKRKQKLEAKAKPKARAKAK